MTTILIVDDEPADRGALLRCLARSTYRLVEAGSGPEAIGHAEAELPDLALIDVMMPGMHGFETARRLKELAGERFLPIILVSGLSDPSSKALGAQVGAEGYLVKPIDGAELIADIENLLARKAEHAALAARNAELHEHARLREELSTLIVHDIKSPLATVLASLDYAEEVAPPVAELRESLRDARGAGQRILRLLNNLLDVARSEAGVLNLRTEALEPHALLAEIGRGISPVLRAREVRLEVMGDRGDRVRADRDVLTRVIENILDNALRYAPNGGRIELRTRMSGDRLQLRIGNDGPAIQEDRRLRVFEKFSGSNDRRGNLGLGMYFCRLAAEAHMGRIWIESERDLPTVFVIELPVLPSAPTP